MSSKNRVLVLGAGNFGTCLAQHLASCGHSVSIWTREAEVSAGINGSHRNPFYLKDVELSPSIRAETDLGRALERSCDVIVLAIPTQGLREVLCQVTSNRLDSVLVVNAAKGIEVGTYKLPLDIIGEVLGDAVKEKAVVLSGPSFAVEVAMGQPTAVSAASYSASSAAKAQEVFHSPLFRVYTGTDPVGLEVAGAMKNIIAIAAGACAGLGFQNNSRAALITRGLAEMTRVGVAMNADPLTFKGLGGVGDLFLTCSSERSRNYTVGYQLAQDKSIETIVTELGSVAEGVATTKSAYELGRKLSVATPITDQVYQVIYQKKSIKTAVRDLLTRDAKSER